MLILSVKTSSGPRSYAVLETISPFVVCIQCYSVPDFIYFSVLPSWFVFVDTLGVDTQRGFKGHMQLMRDFCVYLFCKKD